MAKAPFKKSVIHILTNVLYLVKCYPLQSYVLHGNLYARKCFVFSLFTKGPFHPFLCVKNTFSIRIKTTQNVCQSSPSSRSPWGWIVMPHFRMLKYIPSVHTRPAVKGTSTSPADNSDLGRVAKSVTVQS